MEVADLGAIRRLDAQPARARFYQADPDQWQPEVPDDDFAQSREDLVWAGCAKDYLVGVGKGGCERPKAVGVPLPSRNQPRAAIVDHKSSARNPWTEVNGGAVNTNTNVAGGQASIR